MKQYIGELLLLGVTSFVLTLTGISINQQQVPIIAEQPKSIDSIMQDTRVKTMQIKTLLYQTNISKDTILHIKKSRINL